MRKVILVTLTVLFATSAMPQDLIAESKEEKCKSFKGNLSTSSGGEAEGGEL